VKVCILTATYLPHKEFGAERAVRLLANALTDRGCDVQVVATGPGAQRQSGRVDGHPVTYLPQANFYWSGDRDDKGFATKVAWHVRDSYNPAMGRAVGRMLDELRPDIVHTNILAGFSVAVWRAASRRGIPVVHTLHDYYLLCPRSSMFRDTGLCESQCGACRVFVMPRTWATRFVNAVTAPSHAVLDAHLSRGLFPAASTREVIQYVCPRPATIAERPAVPGNVLGFIGRLTPDKGLSQLLNWMAGPESRRIQGLRLLIAGTGPLEATVRAAAARDDRIDVLGYVAPADFFPRITALAVPSIWNDPSPVVIREAYGYGIPVAGSRFGGIPELIRLVDERLVFEPHDPRDMTRAIELALDPAGRPALETACHQATEQFTGTRVCEQVEAVYRACMNAARRSARR